MRKRLIAVVSALAMVASPALAAEHVVNGGFEEGDFTGFTESDPYGGDTNLVGVDGAYPNSGEFSAYLGTSDNRVFGAPPDKINLSQTITTEAGKQYDFSFALSNGGPFSLGPNPTNSFTAAFGGVTLLSLINQPSSLYELFTYRVTATGVSSTIAFSAANIESYWNLDDVSVVDVNAVSAVPEPAIWMMMLIGFGGIGFVLRRRRRVSARFAFG